MILPERRTEQLQSSGQLARCTVVTATLAALAACSDHPTSLDLNAISNAQTAPNPHNALALNVRFTANGATAARVRFRTSAGAEASTPDVVISDGEVALPVLGLLPDTDYELEIEVDTPRGTQRSGTLEGRTGTPPAEVTALALSPTQGTISDRLFLTGTDNHVVVFDQSGAVVWYREVPGVFVTDATAIGTFVAFVGSTRGWDPTFGYFQSISPSGELLDRYLANAPLYTDNHEILLTPAAGGGAFAHFYSYDLRPVDMSGRGGGADAKVAGHQLLRFAPEGRLDFMWNAWDHIDIDEWVVAIPTPQSCVSECDFDHPNSIDLDSQGNYVMSLRSLNQVMAVDPRAGSILWRLGGLNSDFVFVGDPLNGFSGQHTVRMVGDNVLLFDNGPNHVPPRSRAVEYELDLTGSTATMVWSYEPTPSLNSPFTSSAQRLDDGNTLVAFSGGGHVHEVRPDGTVAWKANLTSNGVPRAFYRVTAITSLYDPRRVTR